MHLTSVVRHDELLATFEAAINSCRTYPLAALLLD
jgi:hypothetical protein